MKKNHDIFGTDIGIATNALKISYEELKNILEEKIYEAKSDQS